MTPHEFANLKSIERRKQMLNENDAAILRDAVAEAIRECVPDIINQTMPLIAKAATNAMKTEFEQSVGRAVVKWALTSIGAGVIALTAYIKLK